jgi:hypothetical protein
MAQMVDSLIEKYGYCVIPKGTVLYRSYCDVEYRDCMFFALNFRYGSMWSEVGKVQIWQTLTDIRVLFLVDVLHASGRASSSIPELFYEIVPEEPVKTLTDVEIKKYDPQNNRRSVFVGRLISQNVNGWLTSLEENHVLEICLLNKSVISKQIELIEIVDNKDDSYYKNSLVGIHILPPQRFFDKSIHTISEQSFSIKPYKSYRLCVASCIKEDINKGCKRAEAWHTYYNLRLKLEL